MSFIPLTRKLHHLIAYGPHLGPLKTCTLRAANSAPYLGQVNKKTKEKKGKKEKKIHFTDITTTVNAYQATYSVTMAHLQRVCLQFLLLLHL